jgi:hypothetical protein
MLLIILKTMIFRCSLSFFITNSMVFIVLVDTTWRCERPVGVIISSNKYYLKILFKDLVAYTS